MVGMVIVQLMCDETNAMHIISIAVKCLCAWDALEDAWLCVCEHSLFDVASHTDLVGFPFSIDAMQLPAIHFVLNFAICWSCCCFSVHFCCIFWHYNSCSVFRSFIWFLLRFFRSKLKIVHFIFVRKCWITWNWDKATCSGKQRQTDASISRIFHFMVNHFKRIENRIRIQNLFLWYKFVCIQRGETEWVACLLPFACCNRRRMRYLPTQLLPYSCVFIVGRVYWRRTSSLVERRTQPTIYVHMYTILDAQCTHILHIYTYCVRRSML